jgi:hypothetical protein
MHGSDRPATRARKRYDRGMAERCENSITERTLQPPAYARLTAPVGRFREDARRRGRGEGAPKRLI